MPELSIVIPTLGRAAVLRQALARLDAQRDAEGRFELIVVADAAERDYAAVEAAVMSDARPYPARVLRADLAGASAARNTGWRAARTPLVLFLGDDILAEPRLVAEHVSWHERNPEPEVAVLGDVRWADSLRRSTFMRWVDRGWQFDYEQIRAAGAGADVGWGRFYTANVSLKRELLERSGGFDESFPFLGEDIELGRRLHDLGLRLLYNPAARAEHLHEQTLEHWRERVQVVARAERRLNEKHPDIPPYYLPRMRAAAAAPAPRALGARLAPLVPPRTPWLGPRIWASLGARYTRALAPQFLAAWQEADRAIAPITVAVVTRNLRDLLGATLRSLEADARAGRAEVWVVDNASDDGSPEMVRSAFPWVKLIASEENLGYGPAINRVAERTASEWIAPANNDIELAPGALAIMLEAGRAHADAGVVAPRLVLPDGSTQHSVHAFPTFARTLAWTSGIEHLSPRIAERLCAFGAWDPERPREVPWAIAAFLLVRRSAFEAVGGFDDRQWLHAEDLDLGWRLARAGWKARYEPRAVVRHKGSVSTSEAFGDQLEPRQWAATYQLIALRRGVVAAWTVAGLNVLGALVRIPFAPRPRRARLRIWARMHAQGLRSRRTLLTFR